MEVYPPPNCRQSSKNICDSRRPTCIWKKQTINPNVKIPHRAHCSAAMQMATRTLNGVELKQAIANYTSAGIPIPRIYQILRNRSDESKKTINLISPDNVLALISGIGPQRVIGISSLSGLATPSEFHSGIGPQREEKKEIKMQDYFQSGEFKKFMNDYSKQNTGEDLDNMCRNYPKEVLDRLLQIINPELKGNEDKNKICEIILGSIDSVADDYGNRQFEDLNVCLVPDLETEGSRQIYGRFVSDKSKYKIDEEFFQDQNPLHLCEATQILDREKFKQSISEPQYVGPRELPPIPKYSDVTRAWWKRLSGQDLEEPSEGEGEEGDENEEE